MRMETSMQLIINTGFTHLLNLFNKSLSDEIDIPTSFLKIFIAFSENVPKELISLNVNSLETFKDFCSMISRRDLVKRIEQVFLKTSLSESTAKDQDHYKECISAAIDATHKELSAINIFDKIERARAQFELSTEASPAEVFCLSETEIKTSFHLLGKHWKLISNDVGQLTLIQKAAYTLETFNLMVGRPLNNCIAYFADIGIYRALHDSDDTSTPPILIKKAITSPSTSLIVALKKSLDYLENSTEETVKESEYGDNFRYLLDTLILFSQNRAERRVVKKAEETDHLEAYLFTNFLPIFRIFTKALRQNPIPPEDTFMLFKNILEKLIEYFHTSKIHVINYKLVYYLSNFGSLLITTLRKQSDSHIEKDLLESSLILLNKLKSYAKPTSEEEVISCEATLAKIQSLIQSTYHK